MPVLYEKPGNYLIPTIHTNPKRPVKEKLVHSGRLFIQFLRESDHEIHQTGMNGDRKGLPLNLKRFEPFIATVTSIGNLHLEPCYLDENQKRTEPRGDSVKSSAYRIVKCKRINSQTFSLDVLNTRKRENATVQNLICHVSHVESANRWVQIIKRLVGVRNEVKLPLDAPTFCFPVCLFISDRMSSSDEDSSISSTSDTFCVKSYRLFLSEYQIYLQETQNKIPPIVLQLGDVQLRRHDTTCTTAPNAFVLQTPHKEYTCIMADEFQYLVSTSLLELWIRSFKLNTADKHPEVPKAEKSIKGCLLVGSNLHRLTETKVCIHPGTRWLECSDTHGVVEKFDVLHSEIVSDEARQVYMCRVLTRQLEPDHGADRLRRLYIQVPTRGALHKWHKHFNLSPSAVLVVLNVILSELESRRHLPQTRARMNRGDELKEDWVLDMEQSVQMFILPRNEIQSLLGTRAEWPNGRLEQLLKFLLRGLAYPVIKTERQNAMVQLMLKHSGRRRIAQRLPRLLAKLLLKMTTFNLCVIHRLTLYMSTCLRRVYPDLSRLTPLERLCLFRKHWLPLITALSHRSVESGTSGEQDPWISAISYFIAAYHYLLHTIMNCC